MHGTRSTRYGLGSSIAGVELCILDDDRSWWWCNHGVFSGNLTVEPADRGIKTSASESALTAAVAARSLYLKRHPNAKLEELVIYTTTETHSIGLKAALVLGLAARSLKVTAEDNFSLRGETLRQALQEDEANGQRPFILCMLSPSLMHQKNNIRNQLRLLERPHPVLSIIYKKSDQLV